MRVAEGALLHVCAGPLLCCAYPWLAMQARSTGRILLPAEASL